jgi:hypothetical protein
MTDRELLEAAAKAAGLTIEYWAQPDYPIVRDGDANVGWNPLKFDSDALRLAVKLGIELHDPYQYGKACAWLSGPMLEFWENIGSDPYSATRRAIVRAAASLQSAKAIE